MKPFCRNRETILKHTGRKESIARLHARRERGERKRIAHVEREVRDFCVINDRAL